MKRSIFVFLISLPVIFGSCVSTSFGSAKSSAWRAGKSERARGTVKIVSVSAEKSGEWGSLEREVTELLPLYFSEKRYVAVPYGSKADYAAEVRVREREYLKGWKTRRYLSVEVRLWAGDDEGKPLPLSAGRTLNHGQKTFASTRTLSTMLRRSVRYAIWKLPSKRTRSVSQQGDES